MSQYSERIIVIADVIERYITEHPRAADTPDGIRRWWVAPQRYGESLADVQSALGYLVERGRLARITVADGTVIYAGAPPPGAADTD